MFQLVPEVLVKVGDLELRATNDESNTLAAILVRSGLDFTVTHGPSLAEAQAAQVQAQMSAIHYSS